MFAKLKKVLKVFMVVAAVVSAIVGVYLLITKYLEKKNMVDDEENYVSCSCCDDEAVAVVE